MGGIFGVASKSDCVMDLFFGIDYHSHLGTRRGGMTVYSRSSGFNRVIHNIENSPFRTKFDKDVAEMEGNLGIGCISDNEPQPLLVRSHLGNFAITTVGKINNIEALVEKCFKDGHTHFLEMSGGSVNPTEVTAALINQKDSIVEGIRYAQEMIEGSMTLLGDRLERNNVVHLAEGEIVELTVLNPSEGDLSHEIDDPAIVSAVQKSNKLELEGLAAGETTITLTCQRNGYSTNTKTLTIIVTEAEPEE